MIPHLTKQSQETPDISLADALAILSRILEQIEKMEYQAKRNMVEMETLRLQLKASGM